MNTGWYFTAPWDPVPVRRGDALGFRAGADYYAELLAPGLSNSTSDARWISILSWCLKWSHVTWRKAGGNDLASREDQRARYAWLRPLELLWVDRTLASGQATGQLRGRRSIERWRKSGRQLPDFAMTTDQFRRYRQIGMYGAYRVVLRNVHGFTTGDGWTPAATALALAELVNDSLPPDVRLASEHFDRGTRWGRWRDGGEARYWSEHGWPGASHTPGGFLPTPETAAHKQLTEDEQLLLKPALFGSGSTRLVTAKVLNSAKQARTHAALCEILANSDELARRIEPASLATLPAFTRFADAAMHAMRGLWEEINNDESTQAPFVGSLARSAELRQRLDLLRKEGDAWLRTPGKNVFPHGQVVTHLAESMRKAATPAAQLRALAAHHHQHGGGRRWFRDQGGKMVPIVADTGIAASDYRFRLGALARLAAQCGILGKRAVLDAVSRPEAEMATQNEPDDDEADAL